MRWRRRTALVAPASIARRTQFAHCEIEHFVQTLTARGTHGYNVPRIRNIGHESRQIERRADLGARHGVGQVLLVARDNADLDVLAQLGLGGQNAELRWRENTEYKIVKLRALYMVRTVSAIVYLVLRAARPRHSFAVIRINPPDQHLCALKVVAKEWAYLVAPARIPAYKFCAGMLELFNIEPDGGNRRDYFAQLELVQSLCGTRGHVKKV